MAGGIEITLERLAALAPGDLLPIDGGKDASLLIHVAGSPKFRALRGALGGRLAFQITETLTKGEVGYGGS